MNEGVGSVLLEVRDLALGDDPAFGLALGAGELVSVSGWDSSELLWAIAGLGSADAGTVLVDGQPIADHDRAVAAGVALIAQGGALAMLLTAYENVLLPLLALDRAGLGSPVAAAHRALELVGLAESADHLVEELSGGQRQRVGIARALAARPRILLADQVTTDLDPANRTRVIGLLRELADAGSGVLLASDDPAVIDACDRAVTL